ncbi:MAG: tetratricopeptide repeat protein [Cyclobacteriaceae bacterium]|nr:tetratricopeptide repeat protein [Cyclobacteriaceae bacterium]
MYLRLTSKREIPKPNSFQRISWVILFTLLSFSLTAQLSIYKKQDSIRTVYLDSLQYYYSKNNERKVLATFDQLIELLPTATEYLLRKGVYLNRLEQYQQSYYEFNKAIEVNPRLLEAYFWRGLSLLNLKSYDSAIKDFSLVIEKTNRLDSMAYKYRGMAYFEKEDFIKATIDFDSALFYNKRDFEILIRLAQSHFNSKRNDTALKIIDNLLETDPYHPDAIIIKVNICFEQNCLNEALNECKKYLLKYPEDESINLLTGAILVEKKEYAASLPNLTKSIRLNNKESFFLYGVANYYLANDQVAIEALQKTLSFNPSQNEEMEIHFMIGVCKNNIQTGSGCADIKKAISMGLHDASSTYNEDCKK